MLGTGQVPVKKKYLRGLRELGAVVIEQALQGMDKRRVQALYLSNMLSDELQSQKHLATLVTDEADLTGIEALHVRAATASGAAALRVAFLSVASGAPLFFIERVSYSQHDRPIEFLQVYHRGDRYSLHNELRD